MPLGKTNSQCVNWGLSKSNKNKSQTSSDLLIMDHPPWVLKIFLEPEFLPLEIVLFTRTLEVLVVREKRERQRTEKV